MMKRTLLPYQARWVKDKAGLKVIEKSRRIGLSWAEAYDAVMRASAGSGNIYYQSYDKDMTRGFIDDCADWARALNVYASAVSEQVIEDEEKDIHTFRISLASGKEIVSMTSAPRAFRSKGRSGDLAIIDEAAFIDDLGEVLKAALAFRVWGGSVHVISTHNGKESPFNLLVRAVRSGDRPGSLHKVTFGQAVAAGLYQRICQINHEEWSQEAEDRWEAQARKEYGNDAPEELDCSPSAGSGAWLSWGSIRGCEDADAGLPEKYGGGPVYIGVDVARRRDLWVAVVIEQVAKKLWVRKLQVEHKIRFSYQEKIISDLIAVYKPVRIAMDQTGMGEALVERMQDKHGRFRIEGVLLTAPRRLDVATALREAFEDRLLRIPDLTELRCDLHSVRAQAGPTGAERLVSDRSDTDGHADRFWALALAVASVERGEWKAEGRSIPSDTNLTGYGGDGGLEGYV